MGRSAGSRAIRNLLGVVIAVLVVAMLALLCRVVFEFFGALQTGAFYEALLRYTALAVLPIAVQDFSTPYGGVFDVRATLSLVVFLLAEFLLTGLRKRI